MPQRIEDGINPFALVQAIMRLDISQKGQSAHDFQEDQIEDLDNDWYPGRECAFSYNQIQIQTLLHHHHLEGS